MAVQLSAITFSLTTSNEGGLVGILYELEQKRLKAERAEIKTKTKEVKEAIDSGDTELIEALEEVREEALALVDAGLS